MGAGWRAQQGDQTSILGVAGSCMGTACSPTGRHSSIPQASLHHLSSGQVSSSTRGRGHGTGARATVQGDRLTGQAWLPGHLPSLGVGGSRPGPTIGWCRGEGVSPEGQGQEIVLFLGTGDMEDPSLSSKNMWHVLDPGSPCPPHHIRTTWGLKDTIHSLIPPSVQPTHWVPGGAGWPGLVHGHEQKSEALSPGALHRPQTPSPHLRWTETDRQGEATWGQFIAVKYLSLSIFFVHFFHKEN